LRAIIGLGNPGQQYRFTRHNAGFLFLDYLDDRFKIPFRPGKGDYYFSEVGFGRQDLVFIKPQTFMNRSGFAVRQMMEFFSISREDLLVVYDDFHLPFGTLRFRAKGSDGGHNGIRSIIDVVESEKFSRLKIGIGGQFIDSIDYVLSDFSEVENEKLYTIFDFSFKGITSWIKSGIENTMNLYNQQVVTNESH